MVQNLLVFVSGKMGHIEAEQLKETWVAPAPGIFLYRLKIGQQLFSGKLIFVK